jgi:hypothetical protein
MLCADLVDVQWRDQIGRTRRGVANLEDISLSGACLQVDRPVPLGTAFRISPLLSRRGSVRLFRKGRGDASRIQPPDGSLTSIR